MVGPATSRTRAPAWPATPTPTTTTLATSSWAGRPTPGSTATAASAATVSCSGRAATASNIPTVSRITGSDLEGRVDALGLGLGHEAVVLGGLDRGGLVDQHDRDVVTHLVAP